MSILSEPDTVLTITLCISLYCHLNPVHVTLLSSVFLHSLSSMSTMPCGPLGVLDPSVWHLRFAHWVSQMLLRFVVEPTRKKIKYYSWYIKANIKCPHVLLFKWPDICLLDKHVRDLRLVRDLTQDLSAKTWFHFGFVILKECGSWVLLVGLMSSFPR